MAPSTLSVIIYPVGEISGVGLSPPLCVCVRVCICICLLNWLLLVPAPPQPKKVRMNGVGWMGLHCKKTTKGFC